jgi:F0F1-type ATP synthase assembly protein I
MIRFQLLITSKNVNNKGMYCFVNRMEKRELIIATIGIVLIIIGLIILVIVPDVSTRFFVGGLITWLGVILLARTLFRG